MGHLGVVDRPERGDQGHRPRHPQLAAQEGVTATPEDEQVEGSRVGIVTGGRYSVGLLFQALMMQSGNDAANALARAAGGVDTTVEAMNETAAGLGAYDTVAGTPSGLDVADEWFAVNR